MSQSGYVGQSYDDLDSEAMDIIRSAVRLHLQNRPVNMEHIQLHALILDTHSKLKKLHSTIEELNDAS